MTRFFSGMSDFTIWAVNLEWLSGDAALRATLILAVAVVVARSMRHRSAAARHLIWMAALAGALALPLVQSALPAWRVLPAADNGAIMLVGNFTDSSGVGRRESGQLGESADGDVAVAETAKWRIVGRDELTAQSDTHIAAGNLSSDPTFEATVDMQAASIHAPRALIDDRSRTVTQFGPTKASVFGTWAELRRLAGMVWLIGVAVFCLPMLLGSLSVWRLARTAQPMPSGIATELRQLAAKLRLRRRVIGVLSAHRQMPMTWGVFRPILLLPVESVTWTSERRRLVLLHELAHIQRWDCLTQLLGQWARAMYWFNPLAWLALSRLRVEQERACDDCVLNAGANAGDYAAELLSVTARLPQTTWDTAVALAMSRASRLEQRLAAILNADCERRPISTPRVAVLMTMIGLVVVGIGTAQRQTVDAAPPVTKEIAFAEEEPGKQTSEAKTTEPSDATKPTTDATGKPSIANGDFEGELQPLGNPKGWHAARLPNTAQFAKFACEDIGHGGQHSVSIRIEQNHPQEIIGYNWMTELAGWKAEQALEVSGWVKTENVSASPHLIISCWDKSDKPLAYASTSEKHSIVGTNDWTRVVTALVVPQGTNRILLRAALLAPANRGGKVWFDDFAVVETTAEAASKTTVTSAANNPQELEAAKLDTDRAKAPAAENAASLDAVIRQIEQNSAVLIDKSALNDAAIRGVIESLKDPYSALITAEQMKEFNQQLAGKLAGIGAALAKEDVGIVVTSLMPNSPAQRGGLKPRDVIVEVDGQPANDLTLAVKAIRGPVGTDVTLKIRKSDKQESQLTLKRGEIRVPSVKGLSLDDQGQWRHWLDVDQKMAFLQIVVFDNQTDADLKAALYRLKAEEVKGLVLDLRGNPGGSLQEVLKVAQLFLKDAVVLQVRGRAGAVDNTLRTGPDAPFAELPLVVLIDPTTASAAEVLATALKDNRRAILVGERTFGKGSVQTIFPLGEGGPTLKLTTAQMFSPSGLQLQRTPDLKSWGVDPADGFFVPLTAEQRTARQKLLLDRETGRLPLPQPLTAEFAEKDLVDPQLAAALKSMSAKLKLGEFAKTGRPVAELQAQLDQRDELRKQRDDLRRKLEQLDRELGENP